MGSANLGYCLASEGHGKVRAGKQGHPGSPGSGHLQAQALSLCLLVSWDLDGAFLEEAEIKEDKKALLHLPSPGCTLHVPIS